jgi:hypothetical protein
VNELQNSVVTIATAIIGLAIVAVLVSRNATTGTLIHNAGSAFSNALGVAEAPVTGVRYTLDLGYGSDVLSTQPGYFNS